MLFSFCFTFNLLIIKENVPKTQWQFSATIEVVINSEPPEIQKINNREILNLDES